MASEGEKSREEAESLGGNGRGGQMLSGGDDHRGNWEGGRTRRNELFDNEFDCLVAEDAGQPEFGSWPACG